MHNLDLVVVKGQGAPVPPLPQATAAARWWADVLRAASALMPANATTIQRPTPEQVTWFEASLADRLTSWCRRVWPFPVMLHVDYQPQEFLQIAAGTGGFQPNSLLPVKTDMIIALEKASVSVGEGAPEHIIWPSH